MPAVVPRNHVYGYTVLVLSAIIWGTEAVVVKLCYAGGFSVFALLSLRYLVSLPMFALVARQQNISLLPPRDLLKPMLLLGLNVLLGVITLYLALSLLPATLAILFFYAYPSFTSLLHVLLKRGPLGIARIAALLLSALGLVLLYWSSMAGLSLLGLGCALLSAATQSVKLFQMSKLLNRLSAPCINFFTSAFTAVCVGVFYIAQSLAGEGFGLSGISVTNWLYLLLLGMVVTVFGNLFMTQGIHHVGAVDTSLVLLLEPPTTALLAFIIFGETLNASQMFGGVLILLAVALPALVNIVSARKNTETERR